MLVKKMLALCFVTQRGEAFMLAVKHGVKCILSVAEEARPLLDAHVIVVVVVG
jgi:hypothetical protein